MGTEGLQLMEPFCENDGVAGVEALNQPEKVLLGVRRNYSARARTSVTPPSCLTLRVVFVGKHAEPGGGLPTQLVRHQFIDQCSSVTSCTCDAAFFKHGWLTSSL